MSVVLRIILLCLTTCFLSYCSDEFSERTLPDGHTALIAEVAHAPGFMRAERYCTSCHGKQLSGGKGFTPSCYQCHGQNWEPGENRGTPSSHEHAYGGFYHHPGLNTPSQQCTSCHGQALEGDSAAGRPSCLLCHTALWEQSR